MALPAIVRHIRNYASAGLIAALAGLITFPVLVKNLSVEEYGILGLVTASLTLFAAIGKLGLQHSVLRFYSQVKEGNSQYSVLQLNTTSLILFLGLATFVSVIWLSSGVFLFPKFLNFQGLPQLFVASTGVLFVMLMNSLSINFLRAQQRSGNVAFNQVFTRYLHLALILLLLQFDYLDPKYILLSLLVTELLGAAYLWYVYQPDFSFAKSAFSSPLSKVLLIYGLPLMVMESLGLVLRASDRYIIEAMLGTASLGQYSASYNLVSYLELIIIAGVMQPIRPMYTAMWESDGPDATARFLSSGFYLYLVLGLPLITIFSLAAPHLLAWLSSPEYEPGTIVIPFVAFSFYLEGAILFLAAGLYLNKRTTPLMWWGVTATVLNIALNFYAVPRWGLLGAAFVTVVSYLVFCVGTSVTSFRILSFPLKLSPMIGNVCLCLVTYWLVDQISLESDLALMFIKGACATVVLGLGLYTLDSRVSEFVRRQVGALMPRYVK